MWHLLSHNTVLRCCHAVRSQASKSIWRLPIAHHCQLWNCSSGVRKPSSKHISSLSQLSSIYTPLSQPASLLNFCSRCATRQRSVSYLRPQRCGFARQLRLASNTTKTFPTVVSKSPKQQVSKREIPKASDVYRLLSLAEPERWKLLGENIVFIVF